MVSWNAGAERFKGYTASEIIGQHLIATFAQLTRAVPPLGTMDEVLVSYSGFTTIAYHRLAHELHKLRTPLIARMISQSLIPSQLSRSTGGTGWTRFFIDHATSMSLPNGIGQHVRPY